MLKYFCLRSLIQESKGVSPNLFWSFRMRAICLAVAFCILLVFPVALAQAPKALSNDDVIQMVKAGLGEDLIVSMVQSQPGRYNLATDDLVTLKQQGLSDKILSAMVARNMSS